MGGKSGKLAVLPAAALTAALAWGLPSAGPAPASKPAVSSGKFAPPTTRQAQAALKKAAAWAEQAEEFAPALHVIDAPHFVIYSAWEPANDKPLADVCGKVYAALCRQFDIPPGENVWVGKCAVYVFWKEQDFRQFSEEVCHSKFADAGGYCGQHDSGLVYIVMGPCRARTWFYELLVHEASHAFLSRYLSAHALPVWLNEGLAEYMAATLVPDGASAGKYVQATREAIRRKRDVSALLDHVGLDHFDYGIAQSFVRFLIARDRAAFVKFVTLLKEGKQEPEALKAAFNLTPDQFLREWTRAAAKALD